ncbi:hypothetical protein ACQZ4X_21585 [Agrobacterium vitis]
MQSLQICEFLLPHAEMSVKKTVRLPVVDLGRFCGRVDGSAAALD